MGGKRNAPTAPVGDGLSDSNAGQQSHALEALGLSGEALEVYRAMLRDAFLGPQELAQELGRPLEVVTEALDGLAHHALVSTSGSRAGAVRPVSPEVALRRLVAAAEQDLFRRQADVAALRGEVEAMVDDHRQDREQRLSSQIEILTHPDAVIGAIEELSSQCTSEILSFFTSRPSDEAADEARPRDEESIAKGATMRAIYLEGQVNRTFLSRVRWYQDRGTRIRLAPTLPVQMLIYGEQAALTSLDPKDPTAGAMVIRAPGLLTAMRALFELQWAAAFSPLDEQVRPSAVPSVDSPLTPLEKTTLGLLARGQKDEALARSLGVSVRTARRIIADLSTRVDAKSRFELAIRAKDCGCL